MIVFYSGLLSTYLCVQLYDRITSYLIVQVFPTVSLSMNSRHGSQFALWRTFPHDDASEDCWHDPICFSPLDWIHMSPQSISFLYYLIAPELKFKIDLAFIKCLICDQHWARCCGYRWVSCASSSRRAHQSESGRLQRPWMEKDKSGAGRLSQGNSQIGKILCAELN